jgi:mutator protein MutT
MSPRTLATVVAAIIQDRGHFLVTRRLEGVHLGGLWEFPGGKTFDEESHETALRREIREELDADVEVQDLIHATTHEYEDRVVHLFFYRCTMTGAPRPLLGQAMRWVAPGDLASLEFPPADAELIRLLAVSGGSD